MKYIWVFVFLLVKSFSVESVEPAPFLKGVSSFTVYNYVCPSVRDLSLEKVLTKALSVRGSIIPLNSGKEPKDIPVFLKLSVNNWLIESGLEVHISLECIDQSPGADPVVSRWVSKKVFESSSDRNVLLKEGEKAVKALAKEFLEAYSKANPGNRRRLTFYVIY